MGTACRPEQGALCRRPGEPARTSDVLFRDHLHDDVGDHPEIVEGIGWNDHDVAGATHTPLVSDPHEHLAANDPDHLVAAVLVHLARRANRDSAAGNQEASQAVGDVLR